MIAVLYHVVPILHLWIANDTFASEILQSWQLRNSNDVFIREIQYDLI